MKIIWTVTLFCLIAAADGEAARAHNVDMDGSGFVHVISDIDHSLGFVLIGMFGGFYIYLFGSKRYVFACMVPFAALGANSHAAILTGAGIVFSLGFLTAGVVLVCAALSLAATLMEWLGVPKSKAQRD